MLTFQMAEVEGRDPSRYRRPVLTGTVKDEPFTLKGPTLDWNRSEDRRKSLAGRWEFDLRDQALRFEMGASNGMFQENGEWRYA